MQHKPVPLGVIICTSCFLIYGGKKIVKIKFSPQGRCISSALRGPLPHRSAALSGWSRSPLQPHLLSLCQKPVVEPYWITAHSLSTPVSLSVKWVTVILQGY